MQRITLSSAALQSNSAAHSTRGTPPSTSTRSERVTPIPGGQPGTPQVRLGPAHMSPVTRLPRHGWGGFRSRQSGSDMDPDDETGSVSSSTVAGAASSHGPPGVGFFATIFERDVAEPGLRFARGLVIDAAELVVDFLGPSADALRLSLVNTVWGSIVRTSDVWIPILQAVAPFSTRAVRRGYRAAVEAGAFSTRLDWVCHLAVAWRRQLELQSSIPWKAAPLGNAAPSLYNRAGWWISAPLKLVAAPFARRRTPHNVVVTGSLGGGKKTFVERLSDTLGAKPEAGMAWSTVSCPPNWNVVVMEVVGSRRIRPLLYPFFNSASAVVIVVDASRPTDIDDLRRELESWIQAESGRAPICIIANHLDRPGALSTERAVERLGLDRLGLHLFNGGYGYAAPPREGFGGRHVAAIGTCLTHELVGASTATTVMQWLASAVAAPPCAPPK